MSVRDHDAARAYLGELASRLAAVLGQRLIGVYAGGSLVLGDYRQGVSDLDVGAVASEPIDPGLARALVAQVRHEALPCPARGLELVVYRLETARSPEPIRDFELNLNTGAAMPLRVERAGNAEATHWFPIDRSVLAQAGVALLGPPAAGIFSPILPRDLLPVLAESVGWHRGRPGSPADAVLNACRALRYASEGRWSAKRAAGEWAIEHGVAPRRLVRAAVSGLREDDASLDRPAVHRFLREVELALARDAL